MTGSLHLTVSIDRPAAEVYAYARDPANLPAWAAGLGRVVVRFAEVNPFGVLDHDVTLPDGTTVTNPLRVLPDGAGCEVVFTLRRAPGTTDEAFTADAAAVTADLATLKRVVEAGR
jgi:uncharacterized protein YndB with AHSA1/START domain